MKLISGIFYLDGRKADPDRLTTIVRQHARNPNTIQVWAEGSVGLCGEGMIVPRAEVPAAINGLHIVADARIDNRLELFNLLNIPDHQRSSYSDSQLILAAYRKWGEDCPEHLHGDFVFAIFDSTNKHLFCVQSPFPQTSFCFARTANGFAFGTLGRTVLALAELPKVLNERSFGEIATLHPVPKRESMFAGVYLLEPATALTVNSTGDCHFRTWWKPTLPEKEDRRTEQDCYAELRELITRAVQDRMRSEATVGCYLSGGLDSSSVACVAARELGRHGKTLTAISSVLPLDYSGSEQDERHFIDVVKKAEDINVQYVYPDVTDTTEQSQAYLEVLEAPLRNVKQYVHDGFYQAARASGINVLLDGYSGELGPTCHGTGILPWLLKSGYLWTFQKELRAVSRATGTSISRLLLRHVVAPTIPRLMTVYQQVRHPTKYVAPITLPLNQDFLIRNSLKPTVAPLDPHRLAKTNPKLRLTQEIPFIQGNGASIALNSEAYGIQTLYPFLDRRIIDFCLSVPAELYHRNGWPRNLIRQSMEGILPDEIRWRRCKSAFSPDFYSRFQAQIDAMRDELASISTNSIAHDYYNIASIIETVDFLKDKPGSEISPEGARAKLVVKFSLSVIRFLQWFESLNVNSNCLEAGV